MKENTTKHQAGPKEEKEAEVILEALEEAKKAKDKKEQRKLRRMLRDIGYFISEGGFSDEKARSRDEKRKARRQGRSKTKTKKEEKKGSATTDRAKASPEDYFDFDPKNPNWNDINKQYRAYCKEYHPDNGGDEEIMKEINGVYSELKQRHGKK